jgi:hypothetical protein
MILMILRAVTQSLDWVPFKNITSLKLAVMLISLRVTREQYEAFRRLAQSDTPQFVPADMPTYKYACACFWIVHVGFQKATQICAFI